MGLKPTDISINLKSVPVGIEDEKAVEQRKRIAKAFEQQWDSLQARALVAHAAECEDPVFCEKQPCFKWEPDKIVATAPVERRGRKKKVEVEEESEDLYVKAVNKINEPKSKKNVLDMSKESLVKNTVDLEQKKE